MIALYGVCAHIKPSRLAAAMLSAVMGDHEAQHYTCGQSSSFFSLIFVLTPLHFHFV